MQKDSTLIAIASLLNNKLQKLMPETDSPESFLLLQLVREELTDRMVEVLTLMATNELDVEKFKELSIEVRTLLTLTEKV